MSRTDIAVIGGGPAGSVIAWRLASAGAAVVLVDDGRAPFRPVGQQLSPSALAVLGRMGVADRLAAVSTPVYEARSAWADPTVDHRPSLLNPYGPPLAVDRSALDPMLCAAAREAGARVVRAHVRAAAGPGGWRVVGTSAIDRPVPVVVDATGSARALSRRRLGWQGVDRLHCTVWQARPADPEPQAWSLVEAVPDGWWYTAPAAGTGELTVMRVRDTAAPTAHVPPPRTAERLADGTLPGPAARRGAVVGCAGPPWAPGLVAAGDAALSVDPLSSSGLRHSLELAGPAAAAALGLLDLDERPAAVYSGLVQESFQRHLTERRYFYSAATRFRACAFWCHRSAVPDAGPPPARSSAGPLT